MAVLIFFYPLCFAAMLCEIFGCFNFVNKYNSIQLPIKYAKLCIVWVF